MTLIDDIRAANRPILDLLPPVPTMGDRIRELRLAKGLKQSELAELAGCKKPYISRLETGDAVGCSVSTIAGIAIGLDVSVDYLLGLSDDLGDAQDLAFYRFYLEQPEDVHRRIRAVGATLMAEGNAA